MKNFVKSGDTVTLNAPYAVTSGDGALVGSLFGVATGTYANAEEGEFVTSGEFDLTRETGAGTAWAVGNLIYWDNTNKRATKTATGNKLIGVATVAGADADTTGRVRLNGAFIS